MSSASGWLQAGAFPLVITLLVPPAGAYLARVFGGGSTWLDTVCAPIERLVYRLCGIDAERTISWAEYARAFVLLGLVGTLGPILEALQVRGF